MKQGTVKRILFTVISVFFVVLLLETIFYGVGYVVCGGNDCIVAKAMMTMDQIASENGQNDNPLYRDVVIHPYLGFTFDVSKADINRLGFIDFDILKHDAESDFNVLILGGSVASLFYRDGKEHFAKRIQTLHPGKNVNIFSGSCSGYKEPQQLDVLTYMLFLGAKIDMVVNIDGYNEVSIPPVENMVVPPDYPRSWKGLVDTSGRPATRKLVGKIALAKELRGWVLETCRDLSGFVSQTVSVLWFLADKALQMRIAGYQVALENLLAENEPPRTVYDRTTMAELADYWVRGSLMMSQIARENGIVYIHVLQPNQYVKDSKPLSREELEHAYDESFPYRRWTVEGYGLLLERASVLSKRGVHFFDATRVFKDVCETLYWDVCCHFNEHGNIILADAVCDYIGTLEPGELQKGLPSLSGLHDIR